MTYDIETPKQRYDTVVSREYYEKYRPKDEKHTIFYHWNIIRGPDSDMFMKTATGAANGSFAALIACIHSNVRHTKGPFTLVGVAAQSVKHGTPWIIAGTTYGLTLSMLTQIRQKESPAHHAVAGYAAGTMLGSWYKWPQLGIWSGGIMAVMAGFVKYWYDNDLLADKPVRRQRLFNMYRRSWFMDRPDAEGRDDAEIDVSLRDYKP